MYKVLGVAIFAIAVAIGVAPFFTDCSSQGHFMTIGMGTSAMQVPMACHWAGRSELAVGIPLAVMGGMFTFTKRKSSLMSLSIFAGILGALAILLPNNIMATCGSATMMCNTVMKPTLTALGSLTIVGSAVGLIMSRKAAD